jgi:Protein of unknown function (DUF2778)
MPWSYSQRTGQLARNEIVVGDGYSGAGAGKNNPLMQQLTDTGPIPRGRYRIGSPRNTTNRGPHVMDLTPIGHNALGRTEFLIHGEKKGVAPGSASKGCIILGPNIRHQISASGDNELIVTE